MELTAGKKRYFKPFLIIATCFKVDMAWTTLFNDNDLQMAFKVTSTFFGISEEVFEFVLDLYTGNPYRIFKCKTVNPKVNMEKVVISAEFDKNRMGFISSVMQTPPKLVKKFATVWINSYNMMNNGHAAIRSLAIDMLGVDPLFFFFIFKKLHMDQHSNDTAQHDSYKAGVKRLFMSYLSKIREMVEEDTPRPIPFFKDLTTEDLGNPINEKFQGLHHLQNDHELLD